MDDNLRFKYHFSWLLSGPSGSGKSSFCIRILQNHKVLCIELNFSGGIIWCYRESSAIPIGSWPWRNKFVLTKESQQTLKQWGKPCLIILDDLLYDANSKDVCELLTKGSHHRNISVIHITQIVFHQGKYCRDISLNAKYVDVLKKRCGIGKNSHI
jgi:DNA replication protein DnaC